MSLSLEVGQYQKLADPRPTKVWVEVEEIDRGKGH